MHEKCFEVNHQIRVMNQQILTVINLYLILNGLFLQDNGIRK